MTDPETVPRAHPARAARRVPLVATAGRVMGLGLLGVLVTAAAACQDDGIRPVATIQAGDTADQILYGVTTMLAPDGIRRNRLQADTAFIYEAAGLYDLRGIELLFYDENGVHTSTLTADSGLYRYHTGAMEAHGNVVVRSTEDEVLKTSVLRYDQQANELSTDQPFTYQSPDGSYEGNGFRSDPGFHNIVTDQPRGGQVGDEPGSMPLPGQQP